MDTETGREVDWTDAFAPRGDPHNTLEVLVLLKKREFSSGTKLEAVKILWERLKMQVDYRVKTEEKIVE